MPLKSVKVQGFVAHPPQKHAVSLGDFADVLGKGSGLTQKTGVVFKITNDFKELMDLRHF